MCIAENGMWDDCMGPFAPAKSAAAPSATKKPQSVTNFLGKKCQCGACCDAGMCLQGIEWEDCMGPTTNVQQDGKLETDSLGRPTHISDDLNGGKIICIGIACGPDANDL